MPIPWKKIRLICGILLLVGLIKMPLETGLQRNLQKDGFHPHPPETSLLEQVGVQSAIGLLGGLRYMVASFLELEAYGHWSALPEPRWEDLAETYDLVTLLQPRDDESWATMSWHLAYNAASWYRNDAKDISPSARQFMMRSYVERGRDLLERGIQWNPDSYLLHRDLASLYEFKLEDPCMAAEWYRRGSQLDDAPSFIYRFYAYNLAKCPGKEEDAYQVLMDLYEEGKRVLLQNKVMIWKPTLIATIKELEVTLNIPEDQRIPEYLDRETLKIVTPIRP